MYVLLRFLLANLAKHGDMLLITLRSLTKNAHPHNTSAATVFVSTFKH